MIKNYIGFLWVLPTLCIANESAIYADSVVEGGRLVGREIVKQSLEKSGDSERLAMMPSPMQLIECTSNQIYYLKAETELWHMDLANGENEQLLKLPSLTDWERREAFWAKNSLLVLRGKVGDEKFDLYQYFFDGTPERKFSGEGKILTVSILGENLIELLFEKKITQLDAKLNKIQDVSLLDNNNLGDIKLVKKGHSFFSHDGVIKSRLGLVGSVQYQGHPNDGRLVVTDYSETRNSFLAIKLKTDSAPEELVEVNMSDNSITVLATSMSFGDACYNVD